MTHRWAYLAVAAVCLTEPAEAEDAKEDAENVIEVSRQDCQRLIRHQPAPDVAFQPGIDVYGRTVAPADMAASSPIKLPDEIAIDIGVDLNEKYGIGQDDDGNNRYTAATQTLGVVKVNPVSGKVTYDGKALDGHDTDAIRKACQDKYGLYGR